MGDSYNVGVAVRRSYGDAPLDALDLARAAGMLHCSMNDGALPHCDRARQVLFYDPSREGWEAVAADVAAGVLLCDRGVPDTKENRRELVAMLAVTPDGMTLL